jgi:hypothetical protein
VAGMKPVLAHKHNYDWKDFFSTEKALFFDVLSAVILLYFAAEWLAAPLQPSHVLIIFIWLIIAVLWGIFGVVRHAGALSVLLKEPWGYFGINVIGHYY